MMPFRIIAFICFCCFAIGVKLGQWDAKYGYELGVKVGAALKQKITPPKEVNSGDDP